MKKLLIVGGAGNLGRAVVNTFKGYSIFNIDLYKN